MVESLQEYIRTWLAAKRHRSLKQLAEECGLNYGTLRNMADGKAVPNGETILRVLLATTSVETMHGFVQEYLPHLSPYTKALTDYGTRIVRPFTITRKHCEVLLEISFGEVSLDSLRFKFGPSAPLAVEDLLSADIIATDGAHYKTVAAETFVPSQALAVELTRVMLDNLNINQPRNMILSHSAGVSLEAARQVFQILEKAQNDALHVLKNPDNKGENRVAVSLAMTMY